MMYIGMLSGTSIDAIDVALVDFSHGCQLLASHSEPIPESLRTALFSLTQTGDNELQRMGEAHVALGQLFADAVNNLLHTQAIDASQVKAIGSHGQSIRHYPELGFTLQIGDANRIAAQTGITTVADFRGKDMALGGQGAPLTPAFHNALLRSDTLDRVVVNIGGIANLTCLPRDNQRPVTGYDTGPGNCLLDAWCYRHTGKRYDAAGQWANTGNVQPSLLARLLSDKFFHSPAPKSTGPDYFNLAWLETFALDDFSAADVQRTLLELTAKSIVNELAQTSAKHGELIICGGGVHNTLLMQRLQALADSWSVKSSLDVGIDPDWMEAMAFAWFAQQRMEGVGASLPAVTGAKTAGVLGGVYLSP